MALTTEEGEIAQIVFSVIKDEIGQKLFYQCLFQINIYSEFIERYKESKEQLDFHNFARAHTNHMTEGIFGELKHAHKMETYKVRTIGNIGMFLSSGHKFLRALRNGLKKENISSLTLLKRRVNRLEDEYRKARNAYEHLDETINNGKTASIMDFSFSIHDELSFKDDKGSMNKMDISYSSLKKLVEIWEEVIKKLKDLGEKSNDLKEV